MRITIAGYGVVGRYLEAVFGQAHEVALYDPPQGLGREEDLTDCDFVIVAVPTPEGQEYVDIRSGTQHGTEIRLRGKGVPHLRRAGLRGDLHVMVDVRIPTRLTARQRELLEEFAEESGESEAQAMAGPGPKASGRDRRKRGIADRLKDAIS